MTAVPLVVDVRDAFCLHTLPDGGAVAALRGLSLHVPAGERLVLHGPNGAGKTTLLRVLAGEQRLAAGSAEVAGLSVSAAGAAQLARWRGRSLGQVDQDPWRLLRPEFDVLTNVALQLRITGLPAVAARDRAAAALESLGLGDLAGRAPGTLSGGQRQKVAVCAALAHGPALVLADEPTGELDLRSADEVYALLDRAVRDAGATLVLVTHDDRAAAIADRVVRIRDGRISETWAPGPDAREALVVDDRGWLRLPVEVRGDAAAMHVAASDGGITLHPTGGSGGDAPGVDGHGTFHRAPSVEAGPPAQSPVKSSMITTSLVARLSQVSVAYGGTLVLDRVDLEVRTGELTVLSGRSGAGKSTLLRVLLGVQRPDAGDVELGGHDLAGLDRAQRGAVRAEACGVVMQQVHLAATLDPAGNLDLARAARGLPADPDAGSRLERLGLAGFDGRPAAGLSGGERQRVALARALVALDPVPGRPGARLLVLDEPTSQLDEAAAELVAQVLRDVVGSGIGVLVATHDPVLVSAADRIHMLD